MRHFADPKLCYLFSSYRTTSILLASLLLCCWDKALVKFNLGRAWVYEASLLQSVIDGGQGRASRWNPGGRNWSRDHRGALSTGLLLMACLACCLIQPRGSTTHSDLSSPSINQQSRKIPQMSPQANRMETIPQLSFPLSRYVWTWVKLRKASHHPYYYRIYLFIRSIFNSDWKNYYDFKYYARSLTRERSPVTDNSHSISNTEIIMWPLFHCLHDAQV